MPTFAYKALTVDGQEVGGELEATDRAAAVRELASRGTCVTEIAAAGGRFMPLLRRHDGHKRLRVRPKRLAILTRQLAVSLEAGLPLMTA